jgi:hypothetical protein
MAVLVHAVGGELADLEEGRTRIEEPGDPIAREQFAARYMPVTMLFRPALRGLRDFCPQGFRKLAIVRSIRAVSL